MYRYLTIPFLFISVYLSAQSLPKMVFIPAGTFVMGGGKQANANDQAPVRTISLDKFSISTTTVTVAQWRYYCEQVNKKMPNEPKWGWIDDHPIINITWNEAIEYTDWLSDQLGKICRLPSEAEWEYVAKEGAKINEHLYSGDEKLDNVGWYAQNSEQTQAVAQKRPNKFGVYDMSGNVWEWCRDWYGWYSTAEINNPTGPTSGDFRVVRGGSWYNYAERCTNTIRNKYLASASFDYIGFRVLMK